MQDYIDQINSSSEIENDLLLTSGENVTIALLSINGENKINTITRMANSNYN